MSVGAVRWLIRGKSSDNCVVFNNLERLVRNGKLDLNKVTYHSRKVSAPRVVIDDVLSSASIS